MKKRFCAEKHALNAIICLLMIISIMLAVSCATNRSNSEAEIISYSIRLAEEKVKLGLPWQAIEIYERAYAEVDDYRLIYNEAVVYSKMGYYSDAVELLEKIRPENSDEKNFLPTLASFYELNGQNKEAKETYEEYLKDHKDDTKTEKAYMIFCSKNSYMGEAYNSALHLWNQQVYEKEVVDVLNSVDSKQWGTVKKLFPDEVKEDDAPENPNSDLMEV